ncbi:MAG: carboxypeptidase regulatory-like domain-containing protein [Ruminococcaceae bacterium]|nr:carboxypeptidase regulatory-like domain-containing protein [Oscillospiraceae bacterium]
MNQENKPGMGRLQVIVNTAGGSLPVANAAVTVYGADAENDDTGILYSLRTDVSGLTEYVDLAAPSRDLSLTPGNPAPYARYNITVHRDGYGTVRNIGIPIFDGVLSTQRVTLIPLSEFETDREERIVESVPGLNPLL